MQKIVKDEKRFSEAMKSVQVKESIYGNNHWI